MRFLKSNSWNKKTKDKFFQYLRKNNFTQTYILNVENYDILEFTVFKKVLPIYIFLGSW